MQQGIKLLEQYFNLSDQQKESFLHLGEVFSEENQHVNLISRKDFSNFYLKHVLHSLSIARVIDFKDSTSIIDVGTGGGMPGIPLAILFPKVTFVLIDSIGKKINAVQKMVDSLRLSNVESQQSRSEDMKGKFDFVLGRAVASLELFYKQTKHLISKKSINSIPNGILYLRGKDFETDLNVLKVSSKIYSIYDFFKDDFFKTKYIVYLSSVK